LLILQPLQLLNSQRLSTPLQTPPPSVTSHATARSLPGIVASHITQALRFTGIILTTGHGKTVRYGRTFGNGRISCQQRPCPALRLAGPPYGAVNPLSAAVPRGDRFVSQRRFSPRFSICRRAHPDGPPSNCASRGIPSATQAGKDPRRSWESGRHDPTAKSQFDSIEQRLPSQVPARHAAKRKHRAPTKSGLRCALACDRSAHGWHGAARAERHRAWPCASFRKIIL